MLEFALGLISALIFFILLTSTHIQLGFKAQKIINECEADIPRNQNCKLYAKLQK